MAWELSISIVEFVDALSSNAVVVVRCSLASLSFAVVLFIIFLFSNLKCSRMLSIWAPLYVVFCWQQSWLLLSKLSWSNHSMATIGLFTMKIRVSFRFWWLFFVNGFYIAIRVKANVPGSIYSDLKRADVLHEDLYAGFNDIHYRWVAWDNWTYTKVFDGKVIYNIELAVDLSKHFCWRNSQRGYFEAEQYLPNLSWPGHGWLCCAQWSLSGQRAQQLCSIQVWCERHLEAEWQSYSSHLRVGASLWPTRIFAHNDEEICDSTDLSTASTTRRLSC